MLTRYLQMIQVQRQDFNGRVLTVRSDDLRAIACILDVPADHAPHRLDALGCDSVASSVAGVAMTALRCLRPHPVLRAPLRLLRVRDLDRPRPSRRRATSRAVGREIDEPRARTASRAHERVLRRRHAVARAGRRADGRARRDRLPLARAPRSRWSATPTPSPPTLLATYVDGGVDRVSLGVQSMVPPRARARSGARTTRTTSNAAWLSFAAAGLPTFNLDLIYGAAGEIARRLEGDDRRAASRFDPPHVSAYALTVEAGTPLADDPSRHPDDDDQADKYLVADELAESGRAW